MMQYFHVNGGDNLLFASWAPASPGAIAGASVVILFLATLERFVNGIRARLEGYWALNALHRSVKQATQDDNIPCNKLGMPLSDRSIPTLGERKRTVPPFILAHELPRGVMYMIQATLTYSLMLTAMTFNVVYFVSIIVGLGVGEVVFGRWASASYR